MCCFNSSLLAKQWWRILHDPELLSHRILKAKYFPHVHASKATKGYRDSYIWQSLLVGKMVVDEGAIWKVGNGKDISVWKDKWVPKPSIFKVDCPVFNPTPLKVAEFIDSSTGQWDSAFVHNVFNEADKKIVESIYLAKNSVANEIVCSDSVSGDLTVKSTYVLSRKLHGYSVPDRIIRDRR
ncbi:hypothetical protein PTKIN_Ptkin12aG0043900 [Pterospermum kingtungense]